MIEVRKDLTGKRFGNVVVLKRYKEDYVFPNGRKMPMWLCKCEKCGSEFPVTRQVLKKGGKICSCEIEKCTYDLTGNYGIGYTVKGEEFWFDLEDYDKIKNHCWHYDDAGYLRSTINKKHVRLHRLVMDVSDKNIYVDHIKHPPRNEHKLDNRKCNLRIVTPKENVSNVSLAKNNTSGATGVFWSKEKNKWQVKYSFNKKEKHIGYYNTFDEALKVRKDLEQKYQGEFSYDNSQSTT